MPASTVPICAASPSSASPRMSGVSPRVRASSAAAFSAIIGAAMIFTSARGCGAAGVIGVARMACAAAGSSIR